jgi:hypothetical protein
VWYSDEALEAFAIVVWSLAFVLFLVALALLCPLYRRDVKDRSTCCNKCVTSLLGLVFVSHLVTSDEGTLHLGVAFGVENKPHSLLLRGCWLYLEVWAFYSWW